MDLDFIREDLEKKFGDIPKPKKGYIVCSSARSGTNLFRFSMADIGFGSAREAFNFNVNKKYGWGFEEKDLVTYVRELIERQSDITNQVFGLKLFWNQFERFQEACDSLAIILENDLNALEKLDLFFPYRKFIYIRRKNKVKQAISLTRAEQSGVFLILNGENPKSKTTPYYDETRIKETTVLLTAHDLLWESFFNRFRLQPHTIWFEDFIKNHKLTLKNAITYLGLPEKQINDPPSKRQSGKHSDDWYARFLQDNSWIEDPEDGLSILANYSLKNKWAAVYKTQPVSAKWKRRIKRFKTDPIQAINRTLWRIKRK